MIDRINIIASSDLLTLEVYSAGNDGDLCTVGIYVSIGFTYFWILIR